MRYLALLRGINVGGNNSIKMVALKACFEKLGFKDVATFIQSGNVIFSSSETKTEVLGEKIEHALSKTFRYQASVVVLKQRKLARVVRSAPKGFGNDSTVHRYNVIFLKSPAKAKQVIKDIPCREGVDQVWAGVGVLYFAILIAKATQSRMSKLIGLPIYKQMTIRNWNTTQKLCTLMESPSTK